MYSICQQIWKTQQWPQDWERSVFIPIPKKAMPKNAQTTAQLLSSHMIVKECSKFSKPGFSNTWTMNFQIVKLVLEQAEEPEIKLPTSVGLSKKQDSSRKHIFLLYWLCQSLWLCGSQETVENLENDRNTRPPDLPLRVFPEMHDGDSAHSCCVFTHWVAFEEVSGPRDRKSVV